MRARISRRSLRTQPWVRGSDAPRPLVAAARAGYPSPRSPRATADRAELGMKLLRSSSAARSAAALAVTALTLAAPAYAADPERTAFDARPAGETAPPGKATRALKRALGEQGLVSRDPHTGTVRAAAKLDGALTAPSGRDAEAVALDYVRTHAPRAGPGRERAAARPGARPARRRRPHAADHVGAAVPRHPVGGHVPARRRSTSAGGCSASPARRPPSSRRPPSRPRSPPPRPSPRSPAPRRAGHATRRRRRAGDRLPRRRPRVARPLPGRGRHAARLARHRPDQRRRARRRARRRGGRRAWSSARTG